MELEEGLWKNEDMEIPKPETPEAMSEEALSGTGIATQESGLVGNKPEEVDGSKGRGWKFVAKLGLIWLAVSVLVGGVMWRFGRAVVDYEVDRVADKVEEGVAEEKEEDNSEPMETAYVEGEQILIPEIALLNDAVDLAIGNRWSGKKDDELPFVVGEFDQVKLNEYVRDELADDEKLTIPEDEVGFYIGGEAESWLQGEVEAAREEFLNNLREKGVLEKYVEEIEVRTLPADQIIYHAENNPNSDFTRTEPILLEEELTKDYRRLVMHVYPVDIYSRVEMVRDARVVGENSGSEVAAAVRLLVYHEMTHVLQQAYINQHLPEEYDRVGMKTLWDKAEKNLMSVSEKYFWNWGGGAFAEMNNHMVADESQAEGLGYLVFVDEYGLDYEEKARLWAEMFGRLDEMVDILDGVKLKVEVNYPEYPLDEVGKPLAEVVEDHADGGKAKVLRAMALRLGSLPAYVGYLHPMREGEAEVLWAKLRED